MRPDQFVGWTLLQTSAVTSIVGSAGNVYYGMRKIGSPMPSINFYDNNGLRGRGLNSPIFSLNCRATTASATRNLADLVLNLFDGSSGTGVYGTNNNFDAFRCSYVRDSGLIPEPDNSGYNITIDIRIITNL